MKTTDTSDPRVASTVLLSVGGGACTGVIVNTNLIVTAGHCMLSSTFTIEFDPDQKDAKQGPKKKSKKAIKHPKFSDNGQSSNFDIGVVTFEGPPPAPYKPIAVFTDIKSIKPKDPVTLAGFGLTKTDGNVPGHLRMVDTFFWKYVLPSSNPAGEGLLLFGPNKGKGSCNGDSGGPVFIKGAPMASGMPLGWTMVSMAFISRKYPKLKPRKTIAI